MKLLNPIHANYYNQTNLTGFKNILYKIGNKLRFSHDQHSINNAMQNKSIKKKFNSDISTNTYSAKIGKSLPLKIKIKNSST